CGFCCFALRTLILSGEVQGKETPMGTGEHLKTCAPVGYCSPKCNVLDLKYTSADCKYSCCIPNPWKGK
uniref:Beta-defensin n=1 Tax=Ficedula albicollis TaxID=59894 RepID=A0A803VVC3_FICAL